MLENVSLRTKCGLSTEHQDVSQTKHEAFNANLAFVRKITCLPKKNALLSLAIINADF